MTSDANIFSEVYFQADCSTVPDQVVFHSHKNILALSRFDSSTPWVEGKPATKVYYRLAIPTQHSRGVEDDFQLLTDPNSGFSVCGRHKF